MRRHDGNKPRRRRLLYASSATCIDQNGLRLLRPAWDDAVPISTRRAFMDTRIRISYPLYTLVNLAARRVIVKPLANGERSVLLFADRGHADEWRARECPLADLWTISTADNLRQFLKGTMSDRTCRVVIDPGDPCGEKPPMISIRDLLDALDSRHRPCDGTNE